VPLYSRMRYNVCELNSGLGCMEAFTEWRFIWCCHLGTFVALFKKKKRNEHNQLFTVTWSAVCAVGVSFVLILEFSERKETVWLYPDCKVPLCMPECFKL